MATESTKTGGLCEDRVISHPDVASRPIEQPAEIHPAATAGAALLELIAAKRRASFAAEAEAPALVGLVAERVFTPEPCGGRRPLREAGLRRRR